MNKRPHLANPLFFVLSLLLLLFPGSEPAAAQPQAAAPKSWYHFPVVFKSGQPTWMGPSGGSVVAQVADPSNSVVFYAGSWGAGVFKSMDAGVTWQFAGEGLGNLYIDSLAIDPKRTNILYAGTHGLGVYKTSDGGQTWFPVGKGMQTDAIVYSLAVNPGNPDLVYAGTRQNRAVFATPYAGVLYRSGDGGENWNPVLTNVGGASVQDWVYSIAVDPGKPQVVFAATHEHGPYRSQDYGSTWAPSGSTGDGSGRAVVVDPRPAQSNLAYYAVWHLGGVFRTTDTGSSWNASSSGLNAAKIYPNGIAIAPSAPDTLYMADFNDNGVWKSTDRGATWKKAGMAFDRIYSVITSLQDANTVLAGTFHDGLYKTTNGGTTWARSQAGITNNQVAGVVLSGSKAVYTAVYGAGVYQSLDKGVTWTAFNNGLGNLNLLGLVQHPANPNLIFALTETGAYRMDLSKPGSWTNTTSNSFIASGQIKARPVGPAYGPEHPFNRGEPGDELLAQSDRTADAVAHLVASTPVYRLVFAPSNAKIAYAGTDGSGIFSSADGGATWKSAGLTGASVRSIAIDPLNPAKLYAATGTAGVIKVSTNSGGSWSDLSLPGLTIYTLLVTPANPGVLAAGTSAGVWNYSGGKWGRAGLDTAVVTRLAVSPAGLTYAGTTGGAFSASGAGAAWAPVAADLAGTTIQSIDFDPADAHHVYFGTTTRGILRIRLP